LQKNNPQKKTHKFRLILDSAFAKKNKFPLLIRKANVAHAVEDCGLSKQAGDDEIYQKAIEENRFVLTININDFKKLVKRRGPGIIGIESQLSNEQIDKIVTKFISGKNPDDLQGKTVRIGAKK